MRLRCVCEFAYPEYSLHFEHSAHTTHTIIPNTTSISTAPPTSPPIVAALFPDGVVLVVGEDVPRKHSASAAYDYICKEDIYRI